MSDSGEEITVDNHTNVQNPKDANEFSAVDAVSLFNTKIDIALNKQRSSIVSELQEKLQVNTEIKGEGIKIQFSFNQERLSNLDRIKNFLSRGSVEEVFELIDSEKKALSHRNKLLRIADRHGWGTAKEYSDSDLTDNSEDASKLRAAIFRASKKRHTPYARNHPTQSSFQRTRPGVFDGMSNNQLFLGSQNYGQRRFFTPRPPFPSYRQNFAPGSNVTYHYCNLPGHFSKFCPYTAQLQRRQPASATVTSPEPFNKQQLEFVTLPQKTFLRNNKSAYDHSDFTEIAIKELLKKDLVSEVFEPPFCVNPLSMSVQQNKKSRLILDLRHVNACIVTRKIKFEEGVIDIPVHKLENLRVKVHNLRFKSFATARELASVVGSIISMRFAYGPICQIFTRQLSMLIANKVFWDAKNSLPPEARDELHFWSQNIDSLSPRVISPWFRLPERIIYTDASDHAGAGILLDESSETFHCMWDDFEKAQSSTFRELKAVELLLKTMGSKLENKFVKLYSDNQNVIRIFQVGSMKSPLQCLAFSIFNTCLLFNIDLSVAWVPRLQNCTADFVSEYKATNKSKPLSYSRCREMLLSALKDIGLDSSLYALHSLRSGGVSAAANNKVLDRLLKVHGRWATDRAKDGYIKDSIEQKLLVSLNLGL
ncbi:unnamed protein product [Mytilus coruscus]|uniref:RNase H type-1 domain-containing protein n=1 Tax=Mytilus coruscus TaxID=42192 RepID=A0A6J8CZX5_MYTCO|nr:unnamed protein product [Mytilus coruscus]